MSGIKTPWRKVDYRINSLSIVIEGLQRSISELENIVKLGGWYDGDWFLEEAEPIYGLGFIAMQHYINGSISDRFSTIEAWRYYKTDSYPTGYTIPTVELIVALANYAKHSQDGKVNKRTSECLKHFDLLLENEFPIDDSPIFKGLELLSPTWNLQVITRHLIKWRSSIWVLPIL